MPESNGKIYEAITAVMADISHIGKDRENPQQRYQFRGIDDVYNALHGPMSKHGIFVTPIVEDQRQVERKTRNGGALFYTTLTVRFRFYASDGSSVEAVTVGEAMDSGDKSANKAMSAAMKYAMLQVFCVPTEGDNDAENVTHDVAAEPANAEPATKGQLHQIDILIDESGADRAAVMKHYKVEKLADLTNEQANLCINQLTAKRAQARKAEAEETAA